MNLPQTREEVVARARALRPQLAKDSPRIDAEGADPTENLRLLGEAALQRINVPTEFGGLWDGGPYGGWREVIETMVEISAADGSTGQCWSTTVLVARELFASGLPAETKQQLAGELIHEGRRLVASNAETGGTGRVLGRRVPGGLVVNGTKTFNTNSGGGGRDLACVSFDLDGARHQALVRLDDPALELRHDWDNMGQRGTYSQTIAYRDVFVPDGWHFASHQPDPYFLCAAMLLHGALLQGIGEGAFEATTAYLRELNRASMPKFGTALEDPLMHRQLGEMSSELAAARALLLTVAAELEAPPVDAGEMGVRGFRAKVASTMAGVGVSARVHDLTGARSTSNRYRFDRFWRNARTFASHDSIDAKNALIGAYELSGRFPSISDYFRF
ncbi:acyl-CoA dehydrogenase family protein [Amycolatopsis dongchuanensis]|uniref:Acyl-CoA dehydrogenase family protein n=1 Tax=Amycolatopsis dongchuanensis TaxID=1070866 RepID=A0ABP9Q7M6_9PSEU